MQRTVVVVGGGIAGLAVSYELQERSARVPGGLDVICLEASERPGGNIRTSREEGFLCEWGPNGFLDNVPATLDLVRRLGMERRLLPSNVEAARRYLFRRGKLRKLPSGAASFLTSDVLSFRGKLRVLLEPIGRRPRNGSRDESVWEFASRRIGQEAARLLVDAMVGGIYAGDVRQLSIRSTFPKLWKMEVEHGSLARAMLARRREVRPNGSKSGGPAGPGGRLTSFIDGLRELTDNLALALGPSLKLGALVRSIADMGVRGFRVYPIEGAPVDAAVVVLACPAGCATRVVETMDPEMCRAMTGIPSASLAVVHLGFAEVDLGSRPSGFGYLVPRGEGPRILGTLWASSIFPMRAAEGKVLLTSMVGGAHDPEAPDLSDERLVDLVRSDLQATMGTTARPRYVRIFRHPRGIPQYTLGHHARLATIDRRLDAHRGLLVCGNSYRGISLNSCVEEAARIADAAIALLGERVTRGQVTFSQ